MTATTQTSNTATRTTGKPRLKPLREQVVVILGASKGIGRESALRCAARGAKVVIAARSDQGLSSLLEEITTNGGEAIAVSCDVTELSQVQRVAEAAVESFGRIDTWVNVAAVGIWAPFEETTPEEFRRVLEVNVMGYVHGAQVALPRLKEVGGGALIAVSSVEGVVALPLNSAYAASKHAVEGLVDALRRELRAEHAPISVTSIKPASINTPFFNNARSKLGVKPKGIPPLYDPAVVADCVVYAAEHPVRDLYAGGAGKLLAINQFLAPGLVDAMLGRLGIPLQRTDDPPTSDGTLYAPRTEETRIEGDFSGQSRRLSVYTWLATHPAARALAGVTAAAATGLALVRKGGRR